MQNSASKFPLFSVNDCRSIAFSGITDIRGNLSPLLSGDIPFEVKRVYYIKNVPASMQRGGHAHKELFQVFFAFNGSYQLELFDGVDRRKVVMDETASAFLVGPGIWRELHSFSSDAICLVLASELFQESDYIRELNDFVRWRNSQNETE